MLSDLIYYGQQTLNYGALAAIVVLAMLVLFLLVLKIRKIKNNPLVLFIKAKAILLVFAISSIAALGSLFFSDVAGLAPCNLCWWQRIFMYPIPLLSFIALIRKEKGIEYYLLPLSVIGGLIALYQYFLQLAALNHLNISSLVNCSTGGFTASCSSTAFLQFGFLTIPLMSLMIFVYLILILALKISDQKK